MGFIQQALEECTSCQSSSQVTLAQSFTGNKDVRGYHDTRQVYNDGKGVQDTVMVSGPLSESFTKGLQVALKKEPLVQDEEPPEPEEVISEEIKDQDTYKDDKEALLRQHSNGPIGIAQESAQLENEQLDYFIREFNENSSEINFIANKFDFVTPNQLPTNVVCNATVISMTDFMKPSQLINYMEDKSDSRIDHVVVVVADGLGRTRKNTTKNKVVNLHLGGGMFHEDSDEDLKDFTAAVEAHVTPNGYKVVIGIEAFVEYLKELSCELHI